MSAVKSSSAYQPVEPNSAYKDPEVRSRMLRELHPVQPITPPIVSPKIDPRELLTLVAQLAWAMEGMSSRVTSAMQQLAEYAVICEVQDRRIRVLEELAGSGGWRRSTAG